MRALRRSALAVLLAVVVGGFVRLRGSGGTPPQRGGWKELAADDLGGPDRPPVG